MSLAVDVHGLNKSFGDKHVVVDVAIEVEAGHITGFLGPNGSGKTTTLRMLCGLLTPDSGQGQVLSLDFRTQADEIKRLTGYMTQRFSLYDDMTVRENLTFVARVYGLDRRAARIDDALGRLGLSARQSQLAGSLSGGWKQRLALATAMLHEPKLLLLDEPTAGVDPKARREFWDEIYVLAAAGVTVLVSTHYMDEAERCHDIGYILNGRLIARGTARQIVERAHLVTFEGVGGDADEAVQTLAKAPGVIAAAAFGETLRVSGTDRAALETALGPFHRSPFRWREVPPSLEDVFIQLMGDAGRAMKALSLLRVFAVLAKEFTQLTRDRITYAMMLGLPIMQLLLFGYAINNDAHHLPAAILVQDQGNFARSVVSAMERTGYVNVVATPRTEHEMDGMMRRGQVLVALTIPPDFTRRVLKHDRAQVLAEVDASDPTSAAGALNALSALPTQALSVDLRGPAAAQTAAPPFEVVTHRLYNPENLTALNVVPGLLGVILSLTLVMMTAMAVVREYERGTMESLLSTPCTPIEIMIGKLTPYVLVGIVQTAVVLTLARGLFDVPMPEALGSWFGLAVGILVFIIGNLSLGYLISTVARSQLQAMQLSLFYMLPSIFLSGFAFPFQGMPGWAQAIGQVLPVTHFIRIVRGALLKHQTLGDTGLDLAALSAFVVAMAVIALSRARTTMD